ncbi:MAG: MATE family efflux transporter [Mobilitalea sp.]
MVIHLESNTIKNKQGTNEITEGVIWKQILIFFFPLLFGTFFQQLYNTADAIFVGHFVGKEALSAVGGTTGTLINLLIGFFIGISSGATVAISQFYGGKNEEEVQKAVHTALALAIAGGAVITFVGILGAPVALKWMGTPDEIMHYSLTFLRIYFAGTIANLIYNMGAGILRAIGDSKRPLYFLILSVALNILLDVVFVVLLDWGVAGAAMATVISQIFSAVLVCITLMRTSDVYKLYLRKIRFHVDTLHRIVRIGFPAGLQSLMYTSSNVIIQTNMNSFGTNTIAAWSAYSKIDGLFWMTMSSFGIAITTFAGQNFGAGRYERVRKGVKVCISIAMSVAIFLSIFLYFVGPYLYRLFTKDAFVLQEGVEILHFMVPGFFTYVLIEILSGTLRGMGNSFIPMLMTGVGICALRVVWIFTMVPILHDVRTVMFSYPMTWTVTSICFIIYYRYYVKKQKY